MQLTAFVAASLALFSLSEAKPQSHLRVHISTKLASLGDQCMWEDKAVKCKPDLFCVQCDKHNGWCFKKNPGEGDQCGGKGAEGPWAKQCAGNNLKCVLLTGEYSQCQKKTNLEKRKMPADEQLDKAPLYGRCKYEDGLVDCAEGLQCIEDSDFSGHCLRREAQLFDQCGGKDVNGLWKASCPKGAHCRVTDEFFSRCLPGSE